MSGRFVKTIFLIGAAVVSCGLAFVFGYANGMKQGQLQAALEEIKIAKGNLTDEEIKLEPQLREYLKGRIYYVIGMKFHDPGYLSDGWDVGTVDTNGLKGVRYFKDPTFQPRTYQEAIGRQ